MVESASYGSDHFPIIFKIGVSPPIHYPPWKFSLTDWVQFDHLCKENLPLDTIELYYFSFVSSNHILLFVYTYSGIFVELLKVIQSERMC